MLQPRFFFTDEFTDVRKDFEGHPHFEYSVSRGDFIKAPADYMRYCYYIINGICRVSVMHDSGHEKVIGYWGKNSIYPIIVNEQRFYLENMIVSRAMTPMTLMRFTPDDMKQIMAKNPQVSYDMVDHYGRYTNLLKFEATTQTYENVPERVCNILYLNFVHTGERKFDLTQKELASIVGTRREIVVRVLRDLRNDGIVRTEDRTIEILDVGRLITKCSKLLQ